MHSSESVSAVFSSEPQAQQAITLRWIRRRLLHMKSRPNKTCLSLSNKRESTLKISQRVYRF